MKKTRSICITTLGALMLAATAFADHDKYQTADVIDATNEGRGFVGASWLIRTEDGFRGSIMANTTSDSDPYTLWVVVFNNPESCATSPCTGNDLGNPNVGGSVFNGGGAIVPSNGALKRNGKPAGDGAVKIDFDVPAHPLPDGLFLLFGDPAGLYEGNGLGAEIHLVLDKHPMPMPGQSWVPDLTTTNFPGAGPATNDSFAIFLACPDDGSCP